MPRELERRRREDDARPPARVLLFEREKDSRGKEMYTRKRLATVDHGYVTWSPVPAPEALRVEELEIWPEIITVAPGMSVRARVIARFVDGSARDVSHEEETFWTSGDTTVLSVTSTGLVIALREGKTSVHATYRGARMAAAITVLGRGPTHA